MKRLLLFYIKSNCNMREKNSYMYINYFKVFKKTKRY